MEMFTYYGAKIQFWLLDDFWSGCVALISFISKLNHCYWEWNESLNIKIYKCLVLNLTKMRNFHPLEVVGRGSETQLQVGEN